MNPTDESILRKATAQREDVVYKTLARVAGALNLTMERTSLDLGDVPCDDRETEDQSLLLAGAMQAGIFVKQTPVRDSDEIFDLVREGFPVIVANTDGTFQVLEKRVGKQIQSSRVGDQVEYALLGLSELKQIALDSAETGVLVAKRELECDSISHADHTGHHHGDEHGDHPTPLRRFFGLLKYDAADVWMIALFALVAGILTLATPLAIESLVNVVSWGVYLQPLVVLALMLFACLALAGVLRILQTVVVEMIQRRQFVRIVGDLAHRFPRANQDKLLGVFPRELANRVFDIMTIQKAIAVLLLDGVSIVLTIGLGMLLLAFYHPFLLGFDIVLLISMISVTWLLGRGGIQTSIDESIAKYRIAHWLQDVIASPATFKVNGAERLAVERANQLSAEYLAARKSQFRVVIRQVMFAIGLQVVASTAVLGLGGWLVIGGQLTLGQLVASELVVTVVVGAFSKAGKSLEKFYDLMAGIDKVGHLLDIEVDPRQELGILPAGPAAVRWSDLAFEFGTSSSKIPAYSIEPGARVAIVGDDVVGRSLLARSLAGLHRPADGVAEVAGLDAQHAALSSTGRIVAYVGKSEVFHATLQENVDLGRSGIGQNRVREALREVGLWSVILKLPNGLETPLQTEGYPLSGSQISQLMLARAIAVRPRLLIIDGLLDNLSPGTRDEVWQTLSGAAATWTLLVVTNQDKIATRCDHRIAIRPNESV